MAGGLEEKEKKPKKDVAMMMFRYGDDHRFWSQQVMEHQQFIVNILTEVKDAPSQLKQEAKRLGVLWHAEMSGQNQPSELEPLIEATMEHQTGVEEWLSRHHPECDPSLLEHMRDELAYFKRILQRSITPAQEVCFWMDEFLTATQFVQCKLAQYARQGKITREGRAALPLLDKKAQQSIQQLEKLKSIVCVNSELSPQLARNFVDAQKAHLSDLLLLLRTNDLARQVDGSGALGIDPKQLQHELEETQYALVRLLRLMSD